MEHRNDNGTSDFTLLPIGIRGTRVYSARSDGSSETDLVQYTYDFAIDLPLTPGAVMRGKATTRAASGESEVAEQTVTVTGATELQIGECRYDVFTIDIATVSPRVPLLEQIAYAPALGFSISLGVGKTDHSDWFSLVPIKLEALQ